MTDIALRPADDTEAAWIELAGNSVTVAGSEVSAAWLAGLSDEELAADFNIVRCAIADAGAPQDCTVLGSPVRTVDGVPTRTYETEAWSADRLQEVKSATLAGIKAEAQRRILARYPYWKQANMSARCVELLAIRADRAWSQDEAAEAAALQAARDWIKSQRAASDAIEAGLPAAAAGQTAYAAGVAAHPSWPADES